MEEIMTPSEVAALLKIHLKTVYKLAEKGVIPGNRIGRSWRFSRSDVLELVSTKSMGLAEADDKRRCPGIVLHDRGEVLIEHRPQTGAITGRLRRGASCSNGYHDYRTSDPPQVTQHRSSPVNPKSRPSQQAPAQLVTPRAPHLNPL